MAASRDAALSLILALGLHGAALALIGHAAPQGAEAAGDGGTDLVTLAPVAGEVAALIATWETPPEVTPVAAEVSAPDVAPPEPAPDLPAPELAPEPAPTPPAPAALSPPVPEIAPPPMADPPPPAATLPAEVEPAVTVNPDLRPKARPDQPPDPKPAAKPKAPRPPKSAPVPAAHAAGQGGGGTAGQAGQASAGTADGAGMEDALAAWGADIRARIERRKTYPRAADGATGTVTLILTVSAQGGLVSVSVAASSGNAALDAAALAAVQAARLPKGPEGVAEHSFRFRLRYER